MNKYIFKSKIVNIHMIVFAVLNLFYVDFKKKKKKSILLQL